MKLHMCVYLHAKFEVSGIILTRFRYGIIPPPTPPPQPQNEPFKSPPRLGLKAWKYITRDFRGIVYFLWEQVCLMFAKTFHQI